MKLSDVYTDIRLELGDTGATPVYSDDRINRAIKKVLADYSLLVPNITEEDLTLTANEKRFTPNNPDGIITIEKIEYYNPSSGEHKIYSGWIWNPGLQRIEFDHWITETETVKVTCQREHEIPSGTNAFTTQKIHDELLKRWFLAEFMLSITLEEFKKNGELKAKMVRRGERVEEYGDFMNVAVRTRNELISELRKQLAGIVVQHVAIGGAVNIDTKADPDGRPMPEMFWDVK